MARDQAVSVWVAAAVAFACLASCSASVPYDHFSCAADGQCPPGQYCHKSDGLCHRDPEREETHADPHVLGFELDRDPLGAQRIDLRPANGDAAGLYMHPGSEATFVLNAGDYRGGYSSIQRVYADKLGPEVRLARSAGAARAFPLDARTCLILQFSGEHTFVFDTQDERVVSILRFDGKRFVAVRELSERFKSDLQDVIPDPTAKDRFFIVDSKREQLLHVAWKPPASLEVIGSTSLRTAAFRSSPSWALWL